jgi:hypothetical protein
MLELLPVVPWFWAVALPLGLGELQVGLALLSAPLPEVRSVVEPADAVAEVPAAVAPSAVVGFVSLLELEHATIAAAATSAVPK